MQCLPATAASSASIEIISQFTQVNCFIFFPGNHLYATPIWIQNCYTIIITKIECGLSSQKFLEKKKGGDFLVGFSNTDKRKIKMWKTK